MTRLQEFIGAAKADRPVYISDVRDAFGIDGTRPFHFHVHLYGGGVRRFALKLPPCAGEAGKRFAADYLNAMVYNALSALGARRIDIYIDRKDLPLRAFAEGMADTFQVNLPPAKRTGYGKCLNVNERTLAALCEPGTRFGFAVSDIGSEPDAEEPAERPAGIPVFAGLPARAQRGRLMGMDIGGTDVKVAASLDGRLAAFKEYDWNPSAFSTAEQLTAPLMLLTRLMRAAVSMAAEGLEAELPLSAFGRFATDAEMEAAAAAMETRLGNRLRNLDGIGLCFPDVVIRNRIVGGESPKTQGMRSNAARDYETEFRRITGLNGLLSGYTVPGGPVLNTNDGPMAAFTAAVEQAAAGRNLSEGFFAHSLGTDLGTGWILPDGSIPEIPLEVYNFIIDLGSYEQRRYEPLDVRSVRNFVTGLPGTLQKYTGQFGVFRLAAKCLKETDPALLQRAFDEGLFRWENGRLSVPTEPADMRKQCLEFFMNAAESADSPAAGLFRAVGECVAVTWRETQYILEPACASRTLFGRLVRSRACFERIREGARRVVPGLRLEAADETLANSPLMKQLAGHPAYTVAQFAQAVGAIYYACTGIRQ
ncbi:MAG: hypothetical protein IKE30_05975 [Clostridia bacterium]|nr:hypothetical protein [Clostridia bacterium]